MNRPKQFLFKPGWNAIFVVLGVIGVVIAAALDPAFRSHRWISMAGTIGTVALAQLLLLPDARRRLGFPLLALPGFLYFPATTILMARGCDTHLLDVVALSIIVLFGLMLRPNIRFLVWMTLCVSLSVSPALIRFLPQSSALAGIEEPGVGADLDIAWTIDGMTAALDSPLDPPVAYVNEVAIRRTVERRWEEANPERIDVTSAAAGEEKAARELLESGNPNRALARARLALSIDPGSGFARVVVAGTLLRRGIRRMRTGAHEEAEKDLAEALEFLVERSDRARAFLALGKTLLSMGKEQEALESFRSATKEAPKHPAGKMAQMEIEMLGEP